MNLLKNIFVLLLLSPVFHPDTKGQDFRLFSTYNDLNSQVTCMALSTDGTLLVTGDSSGSIVLRDPSSGSIVSSLKAFSSPVENITFNSTGRLMMIITRDGEIKIYDFTQKKFIHSLYSPDYAGIRFALFSIADGFIYFNGQGRLYKTRSDLTQPVEKIYEFDSVITNAVITDDRSALIFSCSNALKVLNTRTDIISQELVVSAAKIEKLGITGDNKLVTWSSDGTIVFRSYNLNQLNADLLLWFKAGACSNWTFSHLGNRMVTGNIGNWARIWKPFERTVMQELFGHKDAVTDFVFSADDQTLFTASRDLTIKVWKQKPDEVQTAKPVADTTTKEIAPVPSKKNDTLTNTAALPGSMDPAMPEIELDNRNIPSHVGGRKVDKTSVVEVDQPNIDIYVFDNSTLDGDIMSLTFHNQWILTHYEVTKKKKKISLQLKPDSNNYLVLFADNLGKTPPNTAAISFDQNGHPRIFRLESDLKSCSAINFIYRSK